MLHRRTAAAVLALIACIAVVGLTACGSSDDNGGSTGTAAATSTAGSSTTKAATGEPIKIGTITSIAGFGGIFESYLTALKAEVAYTNAHGGINGRPIDLTAIDDAADPAKNSQAARKLVSEDKVIALAGEATAAAGASQGYLEQQGIPSIAGWATDWTWGKPNMFPIISSADEPTHCAGWASDEAQTLGSKSVAIIGLDYPGGHVHLPCFQKKAESIGLKVALPPFYASLTQTDFRPTVQRAIKAGADAFILDVGVDNMVKIAQAGEQLGFKGNFITTGSLTPSAVSQLGSLSKALAGRLYGPGFAVYPMNTNGQLATDGLSPAAAAQVKAFQASVPAKILADPFSLPGWASGVMLNDALKAVGPDSAKLQAYMAQGTHNAQGLFPDWEYTSDPHLPSRCIAWFSYDKSQQFQPVDGKGTTFSCVDYINAT